MAFTKFMKFAKMEFTKFTKFTKFSKFIKFTKFMKFVTFTKISKIQGDIDLQNFRQFFLQKMILQLFRPKGTLGIFGWPCIITNNSICERRRRGSSVVEIILFNSLQCHAHFALMMAFSQSALASIFLYRLPQMEEEVHRKAPKISLWCRNR